MTKQTTTIREQYPWTKTPFITSAPMRLISTAPLALAVSQSGGLGFLGIGTNSSTLPALLRSAILAYSTAPIASCPLGTIPVGIGFICWGADLPTALQILKDEPLKPVAAWLFAPSSNDQLLDWVKGIREVCNGKTKIWIQVGSVANAIEVARSCRPDVLVIQGSDAGGHGLLQSCSIISLLPECADVLEEAGFGNIPLIAAGGITDGRGTAAALVLGAHGVCMGTRFLASEEAEISNGYKQDVVITNDGGITTQRTKVYDTVRGTTGWPSNYNGRGILNHSFWDHENGMDDEENKMLYEKALNRGDQGWGKDGRLTAYAGSGVGLIKKVMAARDIMEEVQFEAHTASYRASSQH